MQEEPAHATHRELCIRMIRTSEQLQSNLVDYLGLLPTYSSSATGVGPVYDAAAAASYQTIMELGSEMSQILASMWRTARSSTTD